MPIAKHGIEIAGTVKIKPEMRKTAVAAALAAHVETVHMAAFRQKLPQLLASEPKILQYEVPDVKPA